jgi:hypothetical protein
MDSITAQQIIDALLSQAQEAYAYAASLNNCLHLPSISRDQALHESAAGAYINAARIVAQHSGIRLKIQRV